MNSFQIVNEKILPAIISTLVWDINGTITEKDEPVKGILEMVVAFAKKRVYQIFITGRNRFWVERFLIKGIKELLSPEEVRELRKYFIIFPECGLIKVDFYSGKPEIFQGIQPHPLVFLAIRETLKQLCWRREILDPYKEGEEVPQRHFIGRDAEGNLFLIPFTDATNFRVTFPDVFWDEFKEVMGALEGMRDINGEISQSQREAMVSTAEALKHILKLYGLSDVIKVSPVSTAINLVPVVNKVALDKDWAAGRGLSLIQQETGLSFKEISKRTIAIGDGVADFLFTHPLIEDCPGIKIPLVFVGPKEQYQPTKEQENNLAIKAQEGHFGARVTLEVLESLESRFQGL